MPVLEKLVAKYIENEVNEGSIPVVYGKIHVFDRSEKSKSSLVKMKVKKINVLIILITTQWNHFIN
jgi:hypothetical protein